jgi:NAD(P)H-hydrate epimerase
MPWVIDADGLNNLGLELSRLRHAKTAPVLTPHPGEMARLLGKDNATVNADRVGVARSFATEHRCHLVLKGARTVIATAEGKVFINPTGNPGMASGGMGDALAGILVALLGQGLCAADAMKLGVYLHGFVGDRVAEAKGQIGLIASDIIDDLPAGLSALAALKS